jgi:hypothetical protein
MHQQLVGRSVVAKSKTAQRGKQSGAKGLHGRPAQRARAIEARQAAEAEERRRRIRSGLIFGTILVVALGAIAFGVGTSLSKKNDKPLPTAAVASGATAATMPPWAAPVDPVPGIELANLRSATTEAFAEHFHAHLDIKADGKAVAVPANLGLGAAQTGNVVSELHTHDALGIIHIEAPDKTRRYVLGQLFAEWGIRLDATHVGGFTAGAGKTLVGYIDGKKFDGNPAQIELKEHRQIALIFGTAEEQKDPPATFDWAAHKV